MLHVFVHAGVVTDLGVAFDFYHFLALAGNGISDHCQLFRVHIFQLVTKILHSVHFLQCAKELKCLLSHYFRSVLSELANLLNKPSKDVHDLGLSLACEVIEEPK